MTIKQVPRLPGRGVRTGGMFERLTTPADRTTMRANPEAWFQLSNPANGTDAHLFTQQEVNSLSRAARERSYRLASRRDAKARSPRCRLVFLRFDPTIAERAEQQAEKKRRS